MSTFYAVLHVATAVFIVGPMAILPHTGMRSLRVGDAKAVKAVSRSTAVFTYLSLVVFVLGFAVMGADGISFIRPWIWLSIIFYLAAFLLNAFVVVPRLRAGAEALEASPGEKVHGRGAISGAAGLATLLLVVVVIFMVWRP